MSIALHHREHDLRSELIAELHARPPWPIRPPVRIAHLAMVTGEAGISAERDHLAVLCAKHGKPPPTADAKHWSVVFGTWALTWERHTEFSTYTVYGEGAVAATPFAESPLACLPADWVNAVLGELLVSVHLVVVTEMPRSAETDRLFDRRVVGGLAGAGRAQVWTDFALDAASAVRVLVEDRSASATQIGRLVQRVLELETYRMMALLALPLARAVAPQLTAMEGRLGEVVSSIDDAAGTSNEQALLQDLTTLATAVETLVATTQYRFGAGRAYHALCMKRLEDLREARVEGRSTLAEFLDRRLTPAMRTCESLHRRLEALSERVSRAGNLLRTRVDVTLASQNVALLESMDRRAQTQLRLQEMVEGLSVVALTYYAMGLVGYLIELLTVAGVLRSKDLAAGVMLPFVLAGSWLGIRRLSARLVAPPERAGTIGAPMTRGGE